VSLLQDLLGGTRRGLGSLKVVMATGLYKTAAGVVGARLLREHGEALRAYLTIQLRSAKAAQQALAGIEDTIEHGTVEELTRGPTKRASLFLAARNVVDYERLFGERATPEPLSAVPWEPTPPGRPGGWGRGLDELRFSLGPEESELLELHLARGLEPHELTYVLGLGKDELARKLEAARGFAKLLLDDVFEGSPPPIEELAPEAYAVIPPTPAELAASKPAVVPLPPGTVLGERYELEERIGGGEFAYVYRARDVRVPGHVVALKLLHRVARTPAARDGAIRELSLIASAFHPSLVHFKEHGWFEDRLWFVMPFYRGEMLLQRLERGPLELEEALAHFERLARGLAALHAAGIRHQDVKPENIFLVELGVNGEAATTEVLPVLLDLGVATPSGEMALAGTPMYFAPEVAARIFDESCEVPLTPKADVFALALSLLHAIEEPDLAELEGGEVEAFLKKRAAAAPSGPRAPQHRHLVASFARWLAPTPQERPTAAQFADEIHALRSQHTGGARRYAAPRGLREALVGVTLGGLVLCSALFVDVSRRPVRIVPTAVRAAALARPTRESDRVRLLRVQLETESRRNHMLEEQLLSYRRRELGLEEEEPAAPRADADGAAPDAGTSTAPASSSGGARGSRGARAPSAARPPR
jgi:hypothetical protein